MIAVFAISAAAQARPEKFVKDEILVKFKDRATTAALRSNIVEKAGAAAVEDFQAIGWTRVKLPAGMSIDKAMERFGRLKEVEAAQPNFYYSLLATPNDPHFPNTGLYGLTKISAPAAWDVITGNSNTVVAVIDTGIKYTHEDLAANMWTNPGEIPNNGLDDDGNGFVDDYYGYDFFFDDPDPNDQHGHGTHVAGTIGAVGNNGIGVVGVNWNVRLMAIKIYNSSGSGTTSAMLINAYNYVRLMRERGVNVRVTNNSYGGCDEACGYDQATKDAIDALGNAGVLNVFAAGNNGRNIDAAPFYPASYDSPSILSVANSNQSDSRNPGSNFGLAGVDIAAPGTGIFSTTMSGYGSMTGTSMASPHVAGAAALLSSLNPSLSAMSLKATILSSADKLTAWSGVVRSGGRLNASAAVANQVICTIIPQTGVLTVPRKGGQFSVNLSAPNYCDYEARSDQNWIRVIDPSPVSGNTKLAFYVTVSPSVSRTGVVTFGGQTLTIKQEFRPN